MATSPLAGTTSSYIQPQFSTDTNASVAGGIQGMLGDNGYLNSTMSSWYDQAPAQGALGAYSQYDPNAAQSFMNPYVNNVIDANTQQSNQNLMENVLPGVNSTFAGNGQFGSTRNADFTNRAIRDNNQTLANTNATTLMNAQNTANTNYKDWTQMGVNSANSDYQNWLTQANFPIGALGTLATASNAIETNEPLAVSSNSASASDVEKAIAALQAGNNMVNSGSVDWLTSLLG